MSTVLAVHSHGGGTGKSHVAANLAALLASRGRDVVVVDTDVQSPSLHVVFGLGEGQVQCALADYLVGDCEITDTVVEITDRLGARAAGRLRLVPGRLDAGVIARIVGQGYDAGLLDEGLHALTVRDRPDVLILDTHAGMTNETLVALATADSVVLLIRNDDRAYRGASVTTAVTRRLNCPRTTVVVNQVVPGTDPDRVRRRAEAAYGLEVAAVLPYCPDIARTGGGRLFVHEHPGHRLVPIYHDLADRVLATAAKTHRGWSDRVVRPVRPGPPTGWAPAERVEDWIDSSRTDDQSSTDRGGGEPTSDN